MSEIKSQILTNYTQPTTKDILVILPFFNPVSSIRIIQNLLFIQSKLSIANIPYLIIHCLFPSDSPILPISDTYVTVNSNSYAFVKENITAIAIRKYGNNYKKYIMMDTDIIFSSPDWYSKVSELLNKYDVVQPFQHIHYINYNYNGYSRQYNSIIYNRIMNIRIDDIKPGFVLAFTREFFDKVGLMEKCLIGSGDLMMMLRIDRNLYKNNIQIYSHFLSEKVELGRHIKYTYLEKETIYHLYHNERKNRQYGSRFGIIAKYLSRNVYIEDIITKNSDGVYEWIDTIRENINCDVKQYFNNRKDDEIELNGEIF
jgi:hypothetical protein